VSADDDLPVDVHRFQLDDQLLDGGLCPDDAPPALAGVAAAVLATRADASPGELADEDQTVGAMAAVLPDVSGVPDLGRTPMLARLARAKVATIVVASVVGAGVAAAAVATGPHSGPRVQVPGTASGSPTSERQITLPPSATAASTSTTTVAAAPAASANAARPATSDGAAVGPDPAGPAAFGLCTAWHDGQATGKKLDAPPFVNLARTARGMGLSVAAYCDEVITAKRASQPSNSGPGQGDEHGNGERGPGNSNGNHPGNGDYPGNGDHPGKGNPGNSNGPGKGNGNGNRGHGNSGARGPGGG
jgi:hypothetical protein